jgi:hypothetical protein
MKRNTNMAVGQASYLSYSCCVTPTDKAHAAPGSKPICFSNATGQAGCLSHYE